MDPRPVGRGDEAVSYDVYVCCHTCGSDLVRQNNITSNLARMWDAAGCPLRDFNGRPAYELLPRLQNALDNLQDDSDRFMAMEPENGWGTYAQCVDYLRGILAACARDPFATVSVSR